MTTETEIGAYRNRTIDDVVRPYIEEWLQWKGETVEYKFGMIRVSNEEFRTVRYKSLTDRQISLTTD